MSDKLSYKRCQNCLYMKCLDYKSPECRHPKCMELKTDDGGHIVKRYPKCHEKAPDVSQPCPLFKASKCYRIETFIDSIKRAYYRRKYPELYL